MLAVLLAISTLAAPPAPLAAWFSWSAPEECIGAESLAQKVSLRLGRPAFVARDEAELVLIGDVSREATGRYRAHFELKTSTGNAVGTREVGSEGDDCRTLDDAAAVVISVMLNVRRTDLEPALPEEPPAPAPEPAKPSAWETRFAAGGGLSLGLLPAPAPRFVVSGGAA
ncbi:MAG: hypothetical protein JNK82_27260, partial [Myxococcaceae bacterium]|nr:hypothetical protein [Myxococcaceae bacterium]